MDFRWLLLPLWALASLLLQAGDQDPVQLLESGNTRFLNIRLAKWGDTIPGMLKHTLNIQDSFIPRNRRICSTIMDGLSKVHICMRKFMAASSAKQSESDINQLAMNVYKAREDLQTFGRTYRSPSTLKLIDACAEYVRANSNFPFEDLASVSPIEPTMLILSDWILRRGFSMRETSLKLFHSSSNISLPLINELKHMKRAQYDGETLVATLVYHSIPWQLILPALAKHDLFFDGVLEMAYWCIIPQMARFATVESKGQVNVQGPIIQSLLTISSPFELWKQMGLNPYESMRQIVTQLDQGGNLGHPNSKNDFLSLYAFSDIPLENQHLVPLIVCKLFNSLFTYKEWEALSSNALPESKYVQAETALRSAPMEIRRLIHRFSVNTILLLNRGQLEVRLVPECSQCAPIVSLTKIPDVDGDHYNVCISNSMDNAKLCSFACTLGALRLSGTAEDLQTLREVIRDFNN